MNVLDFSLFLELFFLDFLFLELFFLLFAVLFFPFIVLGLQGIKVGGPHIGGLNPIGIGIGGLQGFIGGGPH